MERVGWIDDGILARRCEEAGTRGKRAESPGTWGPFERGGKRADSLFLRN